MMLSHPTRCARLRCAMAPSSPTAPRPTNGLYSPQETPSEIEEDQQPGLAQPASLSTTDAVNDARRRHWHRIVGHSCFYRGEHQAGHHAAIQEHAGDLRHGNRPSRRGTLPRHAHAGDGSTDLTL